MWPGIPIRVSDFRLSVGSQARAESRSRGMCVRNGADGLVSFARLGVNRDSGTVDMLPCLVKAPERSCRRPRSALHKPSTPELTSVTGMDLLAEPSKVVEPVASPESEIVRAVDSFRRRRVQRSPVDRVCAGMHTIAPCKRAFLRTYSGGSGGLWRCLGGFGMAQHGIRSLHACMRSRGRADVRRSERVRAPGLVGSCRQSCRRRPGIAQTGVVP